MLRFKRYKLANLLFTYLTLSLLSHGSPTTVDFQQDQDSYTSSATCTIQQANPLSQIIDWRWYAYGLPGTTAAQPGLIQFDDIFGSGGGQVPASGVSIESAKIWVYLVNQWGGGGTQELNLYPMLTSWDRSTATWSYRAYNGSPTAYWGGGSAATAGPVADVDYDTSIHEVANYTGAVSGEWIAMDVTDIVQAWHDSSLPNNGIIAFGDATYEGMYGRSMTNSALSPILEITYEPITLTTASFQQDLNGYSSSSTCTIQQANPLGRIIDWRWYAFGQPGATAAQPGLIQFDDIFGSGGGQVPTSNVTIQSASIEIYLVNQWGGGGTQELNLYPMLTSWDRSTATWSYRAYNGSPTAYWGGGSSATAGPVANVDYDASIHEIANYTGAVSGAWITLDVTDIVQSWHEGTIPNNGIIAFGDANYEGMYGRSMTNGALSPILNISYAESGSGESGTLNFQQDQNGYHSTVWATIDGSSPLSRITDGHIYAFGQPQSSVAKAGLIRFEEIIGDSLKQLPTSGATIDTAVLHLYMKSQWGSAPQTFTAYPLLKDWNSTDSTWNYRAYDGGSPTAYWGNSSASSPGPIADIDYDSSLGSEGIFTSISNDNWVTVDVTDIVQAWYSGSISNHGLVLFGDNTYDGLKGRDGSYDTFSPRLEVTYHGGVRPAPPGEGLIESLTVDGDQFVRVSDNSPIRFWAVNSVAFYPDHEMADAYAAFLADRGVNCVRWHHMLRSSLDWNTQSEIAALVTYENDTSRELDDEALDRFDYLNARLREHGIYVTFSTRFSRKYLPGDVSILSTNSTDEEDWQDAIEDLNAANWQFSIDKKKMLPVFDERAALIDEEFTTALLTHVNPYTGLSYGEDPQVYAVETINEFASEYVIVAGNQFLSNSFPAVSYWTDMLNDQWSDYTSAHGVTPCDIYSPSTASQKEARSDFLDGLDRAHFQRMKDHVTSLGYSKAFIFSNLWRGERPLKLNAEMGDYIENHGYVRPEITDTLDDWIRSVSRSTVADRPFVIGEFNQRESVSHSAEDDPKRTMLIAGAATYGLLQGWSGITWFSWNHGDRNVAVDGQGDPVSRTQQLGDMISDLMMQDHMRTAGLIFRRGLFARSQSPITIYVDDPIWESNYNNLMANKYDYQPGWQNLHEIRKTFGTKPGGQDTASYMTGSPSGSQLTADTGEIIKDTTRNQLTGAADQAEVFSGTLDSSSPANLQYLDITSTSGFATVILVTEDEVDINTSENLSISRTYISTAGNDIAGPNITLNGLKAPDSGKQWRFYDESGTQLSITYSSGSITLPAANWREGELLIE
ncbi:DNRLRE domain-containing protein [Cerasicoccus arenae]|uniref:DNRLRE domain-containing protein n=1 Tax=Cerasicoccus arenae TaxID=424488 RepID=A0A8J3DFT4_9BACT|nr:DNRLRE domain-containing protein [Cerasicoccus arenae]MBK1859260.1 DNRLRE domain-containing protein [Cerasicoccus arenae]GHC01655.1 hypothetical protein GCM10007047_17770 [Cerasicoccus arenae]